MKTKTTINDIIDQVAEALPGSAITDKPMIRQALNDSVDAAVRAGQMTEKQANAWSQDRAVRLVTRHLSRKPL